MNETIGLFDTLYSFRTASVRVLGGEEATAFVIDCVALSIVGSLLLIFGTKTLSRLGSIGSTLFIASLLGAVTSFLFLWVVHIYVHMPSLPSKLDPRRLFSKAVDEAGIDGGI